MASFYNQNSYSSMQLILSFYQLLYTTLYHKTRRQEKDIFIIRTRRGSLDEDPDSEILCFYFSFTSSCVGKALLIRLTKVRGGRANTEKYCI